jgi:hypothetical protein
MCQYTLCEIRDTFPRKSYIGAPGRRAGIEHVAVSGLVSGSCGREMHAARHFQAGVHVSLWYSDPRMHWSYTPCTTAIRVHCAGHAAARARHHGGYLIACAQSLHTRGACQEAGKILSAEV